MPQLPFAAQQTHIQFVMTLIQFAADTGKCPADEKPRRMPTETSVANKKAGEKESLLNWEDRLDQTHLCSKKAESVRYRRN